MEQFHFGSGDNIAGNKIVYNNSIPPRSLGSIRESLVGKLKQLSPQNFTINISIPDAEMVNLGNEIRQTFEAAGWQCVGTPQIWGGSPYPAGINLHVLEANQANQIVASSFSEGGLKVMGNIVPEIKASRFKGEKTDMAVFIGPNQ